MKKPFNWKLFFILLAAAVFGAEAVVPYMLAVAGEGAALPAQTWQMFALGLVQTLVFSALIAGIGLLCANAIGLGLPILEAALRGEPTGKAIRGILPISIVLGAVAALAIIGLDRLLFQPALFAQLGDKATALIGTGGRAGPWKSFLASFYGGINEEILIRLFIMSLLAWLGRFVSKTVDGRPTQVVLWTANVLAAVLFGLGHLPSTSTIVPLTSAVVLRAIVLNGLLGVTFGYLYMKRGLESAMVSHFSADIVLHVIFGV